MEIKWSKTTSGWSGYVDGEHRFKLKKLRGRGVVLPLEVKCQGKNSFYNGVEGY